MQIDIIIPSVGESVQEAILAQWFKSDGDPVQKDEPLFVIETDKVTLEVNSEAGGVLKILVQEGETVAIGAVVGTIDTEGAAVTEAPAATEAPPATEATSPEPAKAQAPPEPEKTQAPPKEMKPEKAIEVPAPPAPEPAGVQEPGEQPILSPAVRRLMAEKRVDLKQITATGPGGRITKGDVLLYLESGAATESAPPPGDMAPVSAGEPEERVTRKPMSPIRKRIAARLLEAKQNTAMLTTFNEIDMSRVMAIRSEYKEMFKKKHDIGLGFMSFFIKATVEALKTFPQINSFIDGKDVVENHFFHVGVAIGSGRGLVVPVIRHADRLSFADLEKAIVEYVNKIKENRLELTDLEGGTFTITNGGVFGSLLSTPILNIPQSGILGMHKIEKRPVVINDEIVIRPMMYVALSYDHRMVDGREAVSFLVRIKDCIENPERMMMEV